MFLTNIILKNNLKLYNTTGIYFIKCSTIDKNTVTFTKKGKINKKDRVDYYRYFEINNYKAQTI